MGERAACNARHQGRVFPEWSVIQALDYEWRTGNVIQKLGVDQAKQEYQLRIKTKLRKPTTCPGVEWAIKKYRLPGNCNRNGVKLVDLPAEAVQADQNGRIVRWLPGGCGRFPIS